MYFKSLEISGFKSFVDHTNIAFGEGLTGIVGPNGCGKSNISDAIRWVLGEQRPKMLRGASMQDFIFNGSSGRKPAGMAEVSITIAEIQGMIKKPELAEFDEVTVTRRLYRSGESEYLINRTPCRLKDVVDLFLDTGISTRAFSIIEQDQVQRIVTSKPEDRRFIIEEAAGIMKYKHQRQDALNKMQNASANLSRVSDIINELERQRNSLKRQASKAERYKAARSEANQLMLATSADEWRNLNAAEASLTGEISRLEEARASMDADIATRRNNQATMQNSINELAENISRLKESEYQIGSAIERNQSKITVFTNQMDEAERTVERLGGEAIEIDLRLESLQQEMQRKAEELTALVARLEQKNEEASHKRKALTTVQEEIAAITREISFSEREGVGASSRLSQAGSALASNRTRVEIQEKRAAYIERERIEAEAARANIACQRDDKFNTLAGREERFTSLQKELADLTERKNALVQQRKEKEVAVNEAKTRLTQLAARRESLKEIDEKNEGFQEGIRRLLKLKAENNSVASRLKGSLADRLKADTRIETALETVLGEKLQALITAEPAEAVAAIELLREGNMGRGTFLPLADGRNGMSAPSLVGHEGVIGYAADLVNTDDELKPLVHRLLHEVVFVENIDAALRLHKALGVTCVTLRGDVLDRSGLISGGSAGPAAGGILQRKRTIEELATAIGEHEESLASLNNQMRETLAELAAVEQAVSENAKALKEEELHLVHERKDIESLDNEIKRQNQRLETLGIEANSLALERDSLRAEIEKGEASIAEISRVKAELDKEIEAARERQNECRQRLSSIQQDVTETEVALTTLKGEQNMAQADKSRLENSQRENYSRIGIVRAEIEAANRRKKELEDAISGLKEEIHENLDKRHELSGQLQKLGEQYESLRSELEKLDEEVRNHAVTLEQARESLGEAKLRHSETVLRMHTLADRAIEYGLTMDEITAFDTAELNIEESQARLLELREQIAKIGDVNLEAIEDFRQVEERVVFLTAQRDDLLKSIEGLQKVIDKINHTTKQLFEDTFVVVRDNFKELFVRLFNGGEADMILTDENNVLESGIEIIARPPGKKRQQLTLLSMGEKSMTAVAVLFSVFKVKPSPFCLLDEVDAPLDDANIGRFKGILREFTDRTQFLVITHNQKTMAFADRLYGITMQEPGVSKILSVDLVDTEDSSRERLQLVHA